MSRLDEILALPKVTHNLVQGSPEWDAFRLEHDGASEAAAVLGLSKKVKRSELMHAKHTGLPREFSDWLQRNVLDRGHEVEALARPHIEALIGDELYPVTCSRGKLSASCDGLTMDDRIAFEHKQWNDDLANMVGAGVLPDEHWPQCQQILLVTGAEMVRFVVSDGTPERMVFVDVTPERARWAQLVAGWDQFNVDLAAYQPAEIKERPAAEVTLALPALFIQARGEITTSNMKEYGEALKKRLAEVRAIALVTDQDFSNAKESAKLLRENIQQAKLAKEAMLAQTVTVGEAARMIDAWCEDMRLTALKLEQDVEREDKAKKAAMIAAARSAYEQHVQGLIAETRVLWTAPPAPDWAGAIKSKRNFASMQDALDTALANGKIVANEVAARVRHNREQLRPQNGVPGDDWIRLFPDFAQVCTKSTEDFHNLVTARVAAEKQRMEAERERIRAEEEARARAAAAQEQAAREAEERRQRAAAEEAQRREQAEKEAATRSEPEVKQLPATALPTATDAPAYHPAATANVVPMPTKAPPAGPPTLKLGEIQKRIAPLTITDAGLTSLGFPAAGKDGPSPVRHEHQFPAICDALIAHVAAARDQRRAA